MIFIITLSGIRNKTVLSFVKVFAPDIIDALMQSQNIHVKAADVMALVEKMKVTVNKGTVALSDGKLTIEEAGRLFSDIEGIVTDPVITEFEIYLSESDRK